jgi:hypothetical protein
MVDLQLLSRRARRAAEWGRLRVATRITVAVAPLVLLAVLIGNRAAAVTVIGTVLLIVCIGLGWRHADGGRAARTGLALGAIPMIVALVTCVCGVGCLVAGLIAGCGSAWSAMRLAPPRRLAMWARLGLVASLTTALGCVGLGLGSALVIIAAMAAGSALAWMPASDS